MQRVTALLRSSCSASIAGNIRWSVFGGVTAGGFSASVIWAAALLSPRRGAGGMLSWWCGGGRVREKGGLYLEDWLHVAPVLHSSSCSSRFEGRRYTRELVLSRNSEMKQKRCKDTTPAPTRQRTVIYAATCFTLWKSITKRLLHQKPPTGQKLVTSWLLQKTPTCLQTFANYCVTLAFFTSPSLVSHHFETWSWNNSWILTELWTSAPTPTASAPKSRSVHWTGSSVVFNSQ